MGTAAYHAIVAHSPRRGKRPLLDSGLARGPIAGITHRFAGGRMSGAAVRKIFGTFQVGSAFCVRAGAAGPYADERNAFLLQRNDRTHPPLPAFPVESRDAVDGRFHRLLDPVGLAADITRVGPERGIPRTRRNPRTPGVGREAQPVPGHGGAFRRALMTGCSPGLRGRWGGGARRGGGEGRRPGPRRRQPSPISLRISVTRATSAFRSGTVVSGCHRSTSRHVRGRVPRFHASCSKE